MEKTDMTIHDIETRAAELKEMLTSEDADFDAISAEITELEERKKQIKEAEEARKALAEKIANGEVGKETEHHQETTKMTNNEIRNSEAYINAYAEYTKTGDDKECRALLTENVTGGTLPVPTMVTEIIAEAFKNQKILARTRKANFGGNVKVPFEYAAPAATYHEEGDDPIDEEALAIGKVELKFETLKKWVGISSESLDTMNGEAYLRYIYEEIARGIVKARENAVVAAILAAPATADATHPAVPKTGSAAGSIDDLIQAMALLGEGAEDVVCIMTRAQYASYRALQFGAGYAVDPFDGHEVLFNETVTAPIVGDLNGVLENLPKGETPTILYDDKTRMKEDMIDVLGRLPHACGVVGNKYFAKVSA